MKSKPNLMVDMFHCLQLELKQTMMALYLQMLMSKKLELLFHVDMGVNHEVCFTSHT
jgi:hypothetical protein